MLLRKNIKEGLIVLLIYCIITLCLFMVAERIEKLEILDDEEVVQFNLENSK